MPAKTQFGSVVPTLAQFATPQSGSAEMVGRYCAERDVWVVDGQEGAKPIIELRTDIADTSTFTRVKAEHDDTDVDPMIETATRTSTAVTAEVDDQDQDRIAATLLMVVTKTHVQQEHDDVTNTPQAFEPQSSLGLMTGGIPLH